MIFNEINERGQLTQLLQRRLNMLGAAPAPSLMPEIAPTLTLEHDRPEWGWYKGELRRTRFVERGPVVGQFNTFQFYIPTDRRNIAVVTSITSGQASPIRVGRSFIGGGLVGYVAESSTGRDFRDRSTGGAVLCERTNNIAQPAGVETFTLLSGVGATFREPIILAPSGVSLFVFNDFANNQIVFDISWYEREALPGELG